ncbi:Yip1 family protein [Desulfitobacterium sp.]|uniref:Yip1 family protein n=1 Tax=Desulfitobacterium sp. TaxID=49981 RepID=UPI002B1F3E28|nr:Yip1 family protein [Desulfitobacterium sp.]MEA4900030.1 Yip1 family protein [Desulfitobacterium sp.]
MEKTKMSIAKRFGKVIISPGKAFADIVENPRILWPGLVIIVINLALTLLVMSETKAFTEQLLLARGMSQDQIASAMKFVLPGEIASSIFTFPLIWLVMAVILAFYNQLSVGEAHFKQLYSVAVFAWIPSVIKALIFTGLIKTMGYKAALQVSTSLAIFLGNTDTSSFLYRLMKNIDLFNIWGLILLIMGGSIAMKKKPKGLALFMGAIWLVYVVVVSLLIKTPVV